MRPAVLPGPGDWTLKHVALHDNTFILAVNPQHEPRVIGLTALGEMFVRVLTVEEKAVVG